MKNIHKIHSLIGKPEDLTPKNITFFKHHIFEFIWCLRTLDNKFKQDVNWQRIKTILSQKVLHPKAKALAKSGSWFKRFLATQCYALSNTKINYNVLLTLITDATIIVSVNAAILVFREPTEQTIKEVIDFFSNRRRIFQLTLVNVLEDASINNLDLIVNTIVSRMKHERRIYTKIFCYRILNGLKVNTPLPFLNDDLVNQNLELKREAVIYISRMDPSISKPVLLEFINDPDDETRAKIVQLLGNTGDMTLIPILAKKLKDKAWWVRIHAASALTDLGEAGIKALEEQPMTDRFAYETAQAVLKIHSENLKEA